MLVDSVTILVRAGNGGNGAATLRRTAQTAKGGPDGGDGGHGGDVYFRGSTNINDLRLFRYKKKVVAEDGIAGRAKNLFGRNAEHTTIELPLGSRITDLETEKVIEITDTSTRILIARGGRGGRGNVHFKSAINRTPTQAEPGGKGEEKRLYIDLRIIAEIGIVGLPNAGKSTLLAVLTNAKPSIGNYPFTTLEPNIGMMGSHAIADIPGVIEGASGGKGLGTKFLKHIERTKILVHCIDPTEADPVKSYEVIRGEFREFNPKLLVYPEIILLTKADLVETSDLEKYRKIFQKMGLSVYSYSQYDEASVKSLRKVLEAFVS